LACPFCFKEWTDIDSVLIHNRSLHNFYQEELTKNEDKLTPEQKLANDKMKARKILTKEAIALKEKKD